MPTLFYQCIFFYICPSKVSIPQGFIFSNDSSHTTYFSWKILTTLSFKYHILPIVPSLVFNFRHADMLYNFPGYPLYPDIRIFPTYLLFFRCSLSNLGMKAHFLPFRHLSHKPEGQMRSFFLKKIRREDREEGETEKENERKKTHAKKV